MRWPPVAKAYVQPSSSELVLSQAPWINGLSEGLSVKDVETTHRVMLALRQTLGGSQGAQPPAVPGPPSLLLRPFRG
jgi:hypothetical protein